MNSTSEKMEGEFILYSSFFGSLGAAAAMVLCAFGTGYATAKSGTAISAAATFCPAGIMKTLLPVVMAGIISIYGLVASVLIIDGIKGPGYSSYTGYLHFGSGVSVGMTGIGSGYAIGKVGEYGIRALTEEPRFFIGFILILIFAEVIGLYGLIISLILVTK